jgi:hypothetical protein
LTISCIGSIIVNDAEKELCKYKHDEDGDDGGGRGV